MALLPLCHFFFFNDTATTEIYTLSLHDALPISGGVALAPVVRLGSVRLGRTPLDGRGVAVGRCAGSRQHGGKIDRKSTRLNSSHGYISYAGFCLEKKKKQTDRSSSST